VQKDSHCRGGGEGHSTRTQLSWSGTTLKKEGKGKHLYDTGKGGSGSLYRKCYLHIPFPIAAGKKGKEKNLRREGGEKGNSRSRSMRTFLSLGTGAVKGRGGETGGFLAGQIFVKGKKTVIVFVPRSSAVGRGGGRGGEREKSSPM